MSDDKKVNVETEFNDNKAKIEAEVNLPDTPEPLQAFIDHQRNAVQSLGKALEAMIPEGVREHGQTAVSEMLEGYRVLFNSAMDEAMDAAKDARNSADKMRERAEDAADKARDSVRSAVKDATEAVEDAAEDVRKAVDEAAEDAQDAVDEAAEDVQDAVDDK